MILYVCAGVGILEGFDFDAAVRAWGLWPPGSGGPFHFYELLTYGFLHGSFLHFIVNAVLLWMFGRTIEAEWGARRYLGLLFFSLIVSGGAHMTAGALGYAMASMPIIGISGFIAAILVAYAIKYPKAKVLLLLPPIPMTAPVAVGVLLAIDVCLAYIGLDVIAHAAHWGGAGAGAVYALFMPAGQGPGSLQERR